jgi:DNA-binding NarL/FixJ family response regulator
VELQIRGHLLKIGLVTAATIILIKVCNTLLVYHFFRFDWYLSSVALSFLIAGYLLSNQKGIQVTKLSAPNILEVDPAFEELMRMRQYLTSREVIVFKYLASDKTNKEIALSLCIEVSTVKTHINNLYSKINCKNRKEAALVYQQMTEKKLI